MRVAQAQRLRGGIGHRVGVAAVGGQDESPRCCPVDPATVVWKAFSPAIRIADRDRARGNQIAANNTDILRHRRHGRITNHCTVIGAVDGEADLLGRPVDAGDREGIDVRVAQAQRLRGGIGHRVGVAAVAGQNESPEIALLTLHARLEGILAGIRIADRDRARGNQIAANNTDILRHRRHGRITNHCTGSVIGAVDGEADLLGRPVDAGDREGIDVRVAQAQRLRGGIGHRVGVAAVAGQNESPEIALLTLNARLEGILAGIRIADRDRARGNQIAANNTDILRHRRHGRITNHCTVIGAVDGEADLLRRPVDAGDREGIDVRVAQAQRLRGGIGHRVGVAAVAGQNESPEIALLTLHARLEGILAGIRIADRDRARGNQIAANNTDILRHRRHGRITNHCTVIGAVDGEADLFGRPVDAGDREGIDVRVPQAQRLRGGIGHRVGVAAVAGQDERAEIAMLPVTVVWKAFSPASGSLIGIVPEATRLPEPFTPLSSVTADTVGSPITAPSLVPLIVKLTCFVVPSTLVIVKVST